MSLWELRQYILKTHNSKKIMKIRKAVSHTVALSLYRLYLVLEVSV